MTRRSLLKAFVFVLSWFEALVLPWRAGRPARLLAASPQPSSTAPAGPLSPQDMQTLVAFGEVLLEGRSLPAAERTQLVEYIGYRVRSDPGVLLVYQMTATVLNDLTSNRFPTLDVPARTKIMARHGLVPDGGQPSESPLLYQRAALAIRTFVAPDMILGYYGSPAGWAIVGYQAFPGRCSNLTRYTRAEP